MLSSGHWCFQSWSIRSCLWGGLTSTLPDDRYWYDHNNKLIRDRFWGAWLSPAVWSPAPGCRDGGCSLSFECLHCEFLLGLGFSTNCGLRPSHLRAVILDLLSSNGLRKVPTQYCFGLRSAFLKLRTFYTFWKYSLSSSAWGREVIVLYFAPHLYSPSLLVSGEWGKQVKRTAL